MGREEQAGGGDGRADGLPGQGVSGRPTAQRGGGRLMVAMVVVSGQTVSGAAWG